MMELNLIAKILHIRPSRISAKVVTLSLAVEFQNGLNYISLDDTRIIVSEYVQSKRTSEQTRQYAQEFLTYLNQGGIDFHQLLSSLSVKSSIRKKGRNPELRKKSRVMKKSLQIKNTRRSPGLSILITRNIQNVLMLMVQSLESLHFKFVALFVAIGVQMHHSAVWFYRSSPDGATSWPSAIGFAIMYDLFILVVTMEGRTQLAKGFSVLTFVSNLLYFEPWIDFDGTVRSWTRAISSIMISGIIAFILYAYTEIFVEYKNRK